jgi:cytoskeletal protein CcmA (bactofilin family)
VPPTGDLNVIDGFSSVQAVKRVGKKKPRKATASAKSDKPSERKRSGQGAAARKPGLRIGKTAVPLKRELVCYECAYRFILQGTFAKTHCPKCHEELDVSDHKLDSSFSDTLKTMGRIEIGAKAVLKGATLVAGEVVISGNASGANIDACRRVELCKGGRFDLERIKTDHIIVTKEGVFAITGSSQCKDIEIAGTLKAKLFSSGTVTIKKGGLLRGEVHSAHLIVQDGAGLQAKAFIQQQSNKQGPHTKKQPGRQNDGS